MSTRRVIPFPSIAGLAPDRRADDDLLSAVVGKLVQLPEVQLRFLHDVAEELLRRDAGKVGES